MPLSPSSAPAPAVLAASAPERMRDLLAAQPDGPVPVVHRGTQAVYVAGDRARSIQTGRIRHYLMYLTLALLGLFAGVYAWVG